MPTSHYLCSNIAAGHPGGGVIPSGYAVSSSLHPHHTVAGRYKLHNGGSSLQPICYPKDKLAVDNMVPLAQIYTPGSHLYEAATLIRPNSNNINNNGVGSTASMVHWGNVPSNLVRAVNSQQTHKPHENYDLRHPMMIPIHNTVIHPKYIGQNDPTSHHNCSGQQRNAAGENRIQNIDLNHYNLAVPRHHQSQYYHQHPPSHLPLPLQSSTLIPSKLVKSMYDVTRSPEDLTPTNSVPIDSIYNVSPQSDVGLIATTCLSTVSSIPNQNEYSSTLDALNFNHQQSVYHHPDDSLHLTAGVSDTSSSSHPSTGTEGSTVIESSSMDSSGTTSSTVPLTNSYNNSSSSGSSNASSHRKDLPPLPSRADRYRIYAHTNDPSNISSGGGRFNTCRRPFSNSNNSQNNNLINDSRNVKSFDDLQNINNSESNSTVNGDSSQVEASNVVNNNNISNGNCIPSSSMCESPKYQQPQQQQQFLQNMPNQSSSSSCSVRRPPRSQEPLPPNSRNSEGVEDEEALYDSCSDT